MSECKCAKCGEEGRPEYGDSYICMECLPDDLYDLFTEALDAIDEGT